MVAAQPTSIRPEIRWLEAFLWLAVSAVSFHCAYHWGIGWLVVLPAYGLIEISRLRTPAQAFFFSLLAGCLFYAPQLGFLWTVFGRSAILLWLVLAVWVAFFGLLMRLIRTGCGEMWMLIAAPFLWLGLEYFRSELYYLRFAWLTFGLAFSAPSAVVTLIGVYGTGFVCMALAAALNSVRYISRWRSLLFLAVVIALIRVVLPSPLAVTRPGPDAIQVAGIQFEPASEAVVLRGLDQVIEKYPLTRLVMLSEYTFAGPIPQTVRDWCRENRRYLVVGGEEPVGTTNFYDTAYVIGPDGSIVFHQGKSVPVQFLKDGLPAPKQELWQSPWGPIGILVCYDLNYTRVTDNLIRMGARALLVPTMDVSDWGKHEHELAARVAPLRAAEYRIPIFRLASSGVSELVNADGSIAARAPYPGVASMVSGRLELAKSPRVPPDRRFVNIGVASVPVMVVVLLLAAVWRKLTRSDGED